MLNSIEVNGAQINEIEWSKTTKTREQQGRDFCFILENVKWLKGKIVHISYSAQYLGLCISIKIFLVYLLQMITF